MISYHIGKHFVMKRGDGKWYIESYDANSKLFSRAITDMWWVVDPFESFVKAVAWLKLNHTSLL